MSLLVARHLLLSVYFQGELDVRTSVDAESYSFNTAITVREQVQVMFAYTVKFLHSV